MLASGTGKDNASGFFVANKKAPWWAVAFGMVGSSLSGVTFISVPGDVGQEIVKGTGVLKQMGYMQVVWGYFVGYIIIAYVLLPIYYRLNLTSIYEYLKSRFGIQAQKLGSFYFILSRSLGASARLYLATHVLQALILESIGIPYFVNVILTMCFILFYTRKGGMKAIVWTDVFQTSALIIALIFTVIYITIDLNLENPLSTVLNSPYGRQIFWDWNLPNHFIKLFLSGIFIAIVMTGLDQDMMQKNLACKNIREAQKNMLTYSVIIVLVNFIFVGLGALLYIYASQKTIPIPAKSDLLFPTLAFHNFSQWVGLAVLIGLIASAYNAADGTLTAISASITVDLLGKETNSDNSQTNMDLIRKLHLGAAAALVGIIFIFYYLTPKLTDINVISLALSIAGYTYGPLLGLFSFGIFTKRSVRSNMMTLICIISPIICILLKNFEKEINYTFGFELLLLNGLLTFIGLYIFSNNKNKILPTMVI